MTAQTDFFGAKGVEASQLRRRKFELVRKFGFSADLVGGSLVQTQRRCGKSNCHCREDRGHPMWSLTFMRDGKKRVERIPDAWVEELLPQVQSALELRLAMGEVAAINAELVTLCRKELQRKSTSRAKKQKKSAQRVKKRSPFCSGDRS